MLRDEPGAEASALVTVGRQRVVEEVVLEEEVEVVLVQLASSHGCFTFLCFFFYETL